MQSRWLDHALIKISVNVLWGWLSWSLLEYICGVPTQNFQKLKHRGSSSIVFTAPV